MIRRELTGRVGVDAEWQPYVVCVIAAFGAGALMVAHAPLRPWREPAAAGVLAIAVVAALALAGPDLAVNWFVARALHPWYVGLGVAAVSGAMASSPLRRSRRSLPWNDPSISAPSPDCSAQTT